MMLGHAVISDGIRNQKRESISQQLGVELQLASSRSSVQGMNRCVICLKDQSQPRKVRVGRSGGHYLSGLRLGLMGSGVYVDAGFKIDTR
jgi:hypothetical protein